MGTSQALVAAPGQQLAAANHETASSAVAAQAKAMVDARFVVALRQPRSWDQMRVKLLEACHRPGFAETALYEVPRGGKTITGPSIRFVEEALRCAGNVLAESSVVYDDDEKRIVRVTVTDLEANLSYPLDVVVAKTIERRQVRPGQTVVRSRTNTQGVTVYLVEASDDDLLVKQAALTSKALRTSGLRLIPGDIVEEAVSQVNATIQNADAKDPAAAKKKIVDAFYLQGVAPKDLEAYLGHPIDQTSPAELAQLRLIYQAIREGESTWAGAMEQREQARSGAAAKAAPAPAAAPAKGTDALRGALRGKAKPAADPAPSTPSEETPEERAARLAEDAALAAADAVGHGK